MLKYLLIFVILLVLGANLSAQTKQTNSKSKTELVQISNLAGDDMGFECKKLKNRFVGTILDISIPNYSKIVSSIALRLAKGKRTYINFDETKIENLSRTDSRKFSTLVVKGKKIEISVVQCYIGSGPIFYADSIKSL